MFKTRAFAQDDYPKYAEWLSIRSRPIPEYESLPNHGIVIFDESDDCVMAFLSSQKNICAFCNFASNPHIDSLLRSDAINFCLDSLLDKAKQMGFTQAFVNTNKQRLVERCQKRGFEIYDEEIVQLGRSL